MREIIPTIGAISVSVEDDGATIQQESTMGDRGDSVYVPMALFTPVVKAIFEELPTDVLREVRDAASDELDERGGSSES